MNLPFFPSLNASLNFLSFVLLILGYVYIRKGKREQHIKVMTAALISSTLFLSSYLYYHLAVQDAATSRYPYDDWTKPLYLLVLLPHILLATLMCPFIIAMVIFAWKKRFDRHKRLAKWVWPVWVYVSITGVIVYLMLYVQPLLR